VWLGLLTAGLISHIPELVAGAAGH
jgi:hypothetical protein